jgi:hypothetical protein
MAWCTFIPYDDLDLLLRNLYLMKFLPFSLTGVVGLLVCSVTTVGRLGTIICRRLIVRLRVLAYFSGRNLLR